MNDMRTWSTQFIIEFVEIYKSFPCLYNIKSKEYFKKQLKMLHIKNFLISLFSVSVASFYYAKQLLPTQ
jgi:hypothetical protein